MIGDASVDARSRAGLLAVPSVLERAPFSQLWRPRCCQRAQQLPTEDTPPTNSTPPKFQISTTTSIGKYDSSGIGFSKPLRTFWWPVLRVSVGKCGHFFVRDFLIVCAAVACCSTAPGCCPAWLQQQQQQQPAKALEVNRKIFIFVNSYFLPT